jgi:MFS family permease
MKLYHRARTSCACGRNGMLDIRSRSVRPDHPRGSRLWHTEAYTSGENRLGPRPPIDSLPRIDPSNPTPRPTARSEGAQRRMRIDSSIAWHEGPLATPETTVSLLQSSQSEPTGADTQVDGLSELARTVALMAPYSVSGTRALLTCRHRSDRVVRYNSCTAAAFGCAISAHAPGNPPSELTMGTPHAADFEAGRSITRLACTGLAGTSVEWYDFFLYGTASALVFPTVFFSKDLPPIVALIASFSIFAVGFVARPLGAVIFGHFGDRTGRKTALVAALMLMGIATTLIGVLPPYRTIGVLAPTLLVVLRFGQGLAIGGQWGGAVLLIVESAPPDRRGFYSSFAQAGVQVGVLLANGAFLLAGIGGSNDAFLSWAWRIPFVASLAIVGLAWVVKSRIAETAAFCALRQSEGIDSRAGSRNRRQGDDEMRPAKPRPLTHRRSPVLEALRLHPRSILLAAGAFVGTNTVFYILVTFVIAYGSGVAGLNLPRTMMLSAVLISSVVSIPAIILFGALSDRYGRRRIFMAGAALEAIWVFALFPLVETRSFVYITIGVVIGQLLNAMMYGPQAALFAELFTTGVRYSAASLGYQLGAVFGGALAPIIATTILAEYHSSVGVSAYVAVACVVSLVSAALLKETYRVELQKEAPVAL